MNKQKLLVITSYPEKGKSHGDKTVGVASYTKTLIEGLKKENENLEITVFAEKLNGGTSYTDNDIKVKRVWQRNSLNSIINLFGKAISYKAEKIILSFEGYLFGNLLLGLISILGLLLARLNGKKTYILLHQVALDFDNLENSRLKAYILKTIARLFYVVVLLSANNVIVFEEALKNKLGGQEKIKVLPHLVFSVKPVDKNRARKALGLDKYGKYILYFGYIAPYKGILWLAENWPDNDMKLIIAGGMNPNHKNNETIKRYVNQVKKIARKKGITVTGFVCEEDIKNYYSAVNAVILPYKIFMSSSGPLAFAFAYEKPVLLSQPLREYLETKDFTENMKKAGLKTEDIVFNFSSSQIKNTVDSVIQNKKEFTKFAKSMKEKRSLENISRLLNTYISR